MEDTKIKIGLYAYSFRVDVEDNKNAKTIMEFIKKYEVKYYIVGAEVSDKGKQHFQCILWFSQKINASKLRNWWKGRTSDTKQPVSLTSAKKIRSLGKYTKKDQNFITNLSQQEIKEIGQWKPRVQKEEWNKILDKHAQSFDKEIVNEYTTIGDKNYSIEKYNPDAIPHAFFAHMLDCYRSHAKRPSRATLQYYAWKYKNLSNYNLIKCWF